MPQSRSVSRMRPTPLNRLVRHYSDSHKLEERPVIPPVLVVENRVTIAPATVAVAAAASDVVSVVTRSLREGMPSVYRHVALLVVSVAAPSPAVAAAVVVDTAATPVIEDSGPEVDSNPAVVLAEPASHGCHEVVVGWIGTPIRTIVDAAVLP